MTSETEWLKRQLKDLKTRFRVLMEAIPVGLLILDEKGCIEGANPQALILFRCEPSDLINKELSELFIARANPHFFDSKTFREGTAEPVEALALRLNGEQFPADILLRPFTADSGQKVLVAIEDVTKRKELEQMKQDFMSMVTHDLRDPLASLKMFLSMAAEGDYDKTPENLRKRAASTENEVDRLIKMINSLLNIDKVEAGRLAMLYDVVALDKMIETSVQSLSALSAEKGVPIEVKTNAKLVYVRVDADYIVQVMINLLGNALKFSPTGSPVEIFIEPSDTQVKVSICDQGPGIPEEFRGRMFNRFEQARMSDSRVKGGSGLGLAIAKSIIDEHGGSIGVDSEEGRGSTFWFTLPLARAGRGALKAPD